jgi:hypothetical protein
LRYLQLEMQRLRQHFEQNEGEGGRGGDGLVGDGGGQVACQAAWGAAALQVALVCACGCACGCDTLTDVALRRVDLSLTHTELSLTDTDVAGKTS